MAEVIRPEPQLHARAVALLFVAFSTLTNATMDPQEFNIAFQENYVQPEFTCIDKTLHVHNVIIYNTESVRHS